MARRSTLADFLVGVVQDGVFITEHGNLRWCLWPDFLKTGIAIINPSNPQWGFIWLEFWSDKNSIFYLFFSSPYYFPADGEPELLSDDKKTQGFTAIEWLGEALVVLWRSPAMRNHPVVRSGMYTLMKQRKASRRVPRMLDRIKHIAPYTGIITGPPKGQKESHLYSLHGYLKDNLPVIKQAFMESFPDGYKRKTVGGRERLIGYGVPVETMFNNNWEKAKLIDRWDYGDKQFSLLDAAWNVLEDADENGSIDRVDTYKILTKMTGRDPATLRAAVSRAGKELKEFLKEPDFQTS
ncbi:MAG: hypothetical protein HY314_11390 [Acidobacteria bacterium]|nr:hypothetical protein [Acidobacteriota bacterium]